MGSDGPQRRGIWDFERRRPSHSRRTPFRRCEALQSRHSRRAGHLDSTSRRPPRSVALASVPKHLGLRRRRSARSSRLALSAAPKRFGAGSPFRPVLQPTIGSTVVRNANDAWEHNFTGEIGCPGLRCRPRRDAVDSVFPSSRAVGPVPSKQPFRSTEVLRSSVSGGKPVGHPPDPWVPPHRTRVGSHLPRQAGHPGNPSNQAFRLLPARKAPGRRNAPVPSPPSARPSEDARSTAQKRRGLSVVVGPDLPATSRFGRSPVRAARRVPTRQPRLAGSFSSAQRRVGHRLRRLRAQSDRYTVHRSARV